MSEKRSGYLLLSLGIIIMLFSLSYILLVFTGQRDPVPVVSIPAPKIDLSSLVPGSAGLPGLTLPKNEIEVIPTLQLNKIMNMGITLLMSGFVMSFGFKIASLGVMFIRPIKVDLIQKSQQPPQ